MSHYFLQRCIIHCVKFVLHNFWCGIQLLFHLINGTLRITTLRHAALKATATTRPKAYCSVMPILQQPLISMFTRTWNRRKSASTRCSSLLENREEQMKAEYREVISLLRKGYSIRDVAKLSGKGVSTIQRVKRLIKVQSPQ